MITLSKMMLRDDTKEKKFPKQRITNRMKRETETVYIILEYHVAIIHLLNHEKFICDISWIHISHAVSPLSIAWYLDN